MLHKQAQKEVLDAEGNATGKFENATGKFEDDAILDTQPVRDNLQVRI